MMPPSTQPEMSCWSVTSWVTYAPQYRPPPFAFEGATRPVNANTSRAATVKPIAIHTSGSRRDRLPLRVASKLPRPGMSMFDSIRLPTWWSACGDWPGVELPALPSARTGRQRHGRRRGPRRKVSGTGARDSFRGDPSWTVSGPKPPFQRAVRSAQPRVAETAAPGRDAVAAGRPDDPTTLQGDGLRHLRGAAAGARHACRGDRRARVRAGMP